MIDGFVLGEQTDAGRDYRCESFSSLRNFTTCERTRQERTRRGAFTSTLSILSNAQGEAVYVNRLIEPAFFGSRDISSEISRLSTRFGERARETRLPARDDAPAITIAVWGDLRLEALDDAALAALGTGDATAQPLVFDPLGDPKRAAGMGLPVYRLTGGAGFLWSATSTNGRGRLRFLTANPSAFVEAPPEVVTVKAKSTKPVAVYRAASLAAAAAVQTDAVQAAGVQTTTVPKAATTVPKAAAQTPVAAVGPEPSGGVSANITVVAKTRPDYVVPILPRSEIDRAVLESERLAPDHTGSIQLASSATTLVPAAEPPAQHRLETILALAGMSAVLLFFFASLVERLIREPTGLELLELRRLQGIEDDVADFDTEESPEVRIEADRLVLLRISTGLANLATFGEELRSMLTRTRWAVASRL